MSIICEGCGQRVPIPEGYRRNKIQCVCGVICPVPESARQGAEAVPKRPAAKSPSRAVEEEAERWLLDEEPVSPSESEPPRFRDPEPSAEPAPARKSATFERRFPCRRCGRLVRRQGECPDCNADTMPAAAKEEVVWFPSVDAPDDKSEEEDSSPYGIEGEDDVKCPKCCFMLPPGSVLCVRCGFHLKQRKKIAKTYQPIARVWETNASYPTRLTVFGLCEAAFGGLGLIGVFWGGANLGVFLGSFLVLTMMLAFLFGTFDRIHLTRDTRGRVQLAKTWRVAFFAQPPRMIDVRSYEAIASGRHRPVSPWDAWLLLFLIIFGIIPGLIWWYLIFYRITYHVALTRDHGFPEYLVYSGSSQSQMKEIASTLRDASGLRYDEG